MKGDKKGLSAGSIAALALTFFVILGCIAFFSAFRTEGNVVMSAKKMAGLMKEALETQTDEEENASSVRTVTVTLAPVSHTNPVPTETPLPQTRRATLTVGGLVAFKSAISDAVYDRSRGQCDYAPVLSDLARYMRSDFNAVVFPQMLGAEKQNYSDAMVSFPETAEALRAAGADTLLLHTGSVLEKGIETAAETAGRLADAGFRVWGLNSGNAVQHTLVDQGGIRIAFLSYTASASNLVKSLLQSASGQGVMKQYAEEAALKEIRSAREQGADCVAVFIHWGSGKETSVTDDMRSMAKSLTAAGADLILGTGPSRLLPIEKVVTSDTDGMPRQAVVVYSLGTLLDESRDAYDISGALLHITLEKQENQGTAAVSLAYTPTYIWRQTVNGKMQYKVVISDEEPPEGMNEKQIEIMGRALERVRSIWDSGLSIHSD